MTPTLHIFRRETNAAIENATLSLHIFTRETNAVWMTENWPIAHQRASTSNLSLSEEKGRFRNCGYFEGFLVLSGYAWVDRAITAINRDSPHISERSEERRCSSLIVFLEASYKPNRRWESGRVELAQRAWIRQSFRPIFMIDRIVFFCLTCTRNPGFRTVPSQLDRRKSQWLTFYFESVSEALQNDNSSADHRNRNCHISERFNN